ncbi:hypothetical protein RBG61_04320 [Paludicola sp. MB14-C6]|uniref:glycoside hydrolase family 38 N-terminal domain-containing protein n=1 Tax=Paludihabitans sp. MB14-C6 TaxID=3070656 RepID=UPI0027DD9BBB|nr:hypothetical protein [Paludicola sp. MB14-C6]WMJ23900.1 hypothetical protein RBG61_04320 [Paludicola sp. MB14-C6]
MNRKIKDIYVVHHSHTDIGYTDLQERVVYTHIDYIRSAIDIIKKGYENNTGDKNFKWNCETYFCVEKFLEEATEQEKSDFYDLVKKGNIGISGTYLNFNDLVDKAVLNKRTKEMVSIFEAQNIPVKAAMNADINGISMGARDVFIDNGIEFLFTNIHTHHGMYPLYHNQTPYFWENEQGKKLLVFSGEHYNLGNALGIVYNKNINFMTQNYFGKQNAFDSHIETLKFNVDKCFEQYLEYNYPYSFLVTSVSGVFSDNAPPNTNILRTIEAFNETYGEEVTMHMVTVEELYHLIKEEIKDAPTYKGDLNDWWANGVGSTPYAVKHYKEAQRMYHLCERLNKKANAAKDCFTREAEDNLMLYAEHTWGHSSTITNPYDTMVQNLDIRNTSYASKAHESAAKNLNRIQHKLGDKLRYYDLDGKIKAFNAGSQEGKMPVEFYVETMRLPGVKITNAKTGEVIPAQLSAHPRGVLVSFLDNFAAHEEKEYTYEQQPEADTTFNTRIAYVGAERIRDIVTDYDNTYTLKYGIENDFMRISYEIGKGVTSFFNKLENKEMLKDGYAKFFTPIYENTEIRTDVYEERRVIGRNIRGIHAKQYQAELSDIKVIENGSVFTMIELVYNLEGTYHSSVVIKLYREIPKLEFKYKLAKTLSEDIESIFMPLSLDMNSSELFINKGDTIMRPGIDQIPGTCMEYYTVDNGVIYTGKESNVLIQCKDVPLIYMGEMKHHPIVLCDNKPENNKRDVYSWVMNNTWETNFKMDLSGFTEYCYTVDIIKATNINNSFETLKDNAFGVVTFITE